MKYDPTKMLTPGAVLRLTNTAFVFRKQVFRKCVDQINIDDGDWFSVDDLGLEHNDLVTLIGVTPAGWHLVLHHTCTFWFYRTTDHYFEVIHAAR